MKPRFPRWFAPSLLLLTADFPAGAVVPLTAPPLPERVALADLIALGKVTAVEEDLVEAAPLVKIPGVTKKVSYRLAVVSIQSPLLGAEKSERIRVAFAPPPADGARTGRGTGRFALVRLAAGDEGCFFLRKHPDQPFYVAAASYDFLDKSKTKAFDKDIAEVKRCVSLLGDANAGLRSKQPDERLLTAALLIYRYRTPRHVYRGKPKTEPVEAEQSQRILAALADGDWNMKETPVPGSALSLFLRLGLTKAEGWEPPPALAELPAAAQTWLRKHSDYRIQRYVPPDENGD
jgi:hypothetical protein